MIRTVFTPTQRRENPVSAKIEKILVTSALPYANGPIHFGHIAGAYLPADIFVRHKRMCGADIVYICGSDDHGVAITISAQKEGRSPAEHVRINHRLIADIFDRINIRFDNFSQTSRPLHYGVSQEFFTDAVRAGYMETRNDRQLYCETDRMFLADRYVTGTCPHCGFVGARGDECGGCGKWLDPQELLNPACKVCGSTPVVRETTNWYFLLDRLQPKIEAWLAEKPHWKDNVMNFVRAWLDKGLQPRSMTRDIEWGIPVPAEGADGKVLYVWFDAPIGYISSTIEWADRIGDPERWKRYWHAPDTRLVHFIGKDNIPFHCIVFPAMIMAKNEVRPEQIVLPENVPANEFYNLEGRQFSKSEGWYIDLDDFFSKYSVDALRYTLCANMPQTKDSEFTWHDFGLRNNSELADIFGNLAQRVLKFIEKYFELAVPELGTIDAEDQALLDRAVALPGRIAEEVDRFEFRRALYEWIDLARETNKYFDYKAPWKTVKEDRAVCARTLHVCLRSLQTLAVTAFPFMPETAQKLWTMLGREGRVEERDWFTGALQPFETDAKLGSPEILFVKIEPAQIEAEVARLKSWAEAAAPRPAAPAVEYAPLRDLVEYEDFAKLDLRAAKIVAAEAVPKSKKLVKLQIDLGFEKRQIVAGIAEHFTPEDLVGRDIVVVANLKPATLMGVESNGMLLAARIGDRLTLLTTNTEPGATVS
ncbi:MAG: methionine--tRNA ligase [Deltaproteobacteria bacterium]|nr:methionine--tRNA ligase [Deltaproteobacteria bacterium]